MLFENKTAKSKENKSNLDFESQGIHELPHRLRQIVESSHNLLKPKKNYAIPTCCSSAMHTVLRGKSKNWLVRNQDNVSEWGDMALRGVLFQ